MITTKEAAALLGISQRRVVSLIEAGDISAKRAGRMWLLDEASVRKRLTSPTLKGRPRMGQKNLLNLGTFTLMNRQHEVLDFAYDYQKKTASIINPKEGIAWAPLGIGRNGIPNNLDLALWIGRRYMPPLRPEATRLLQQTGAPSVDALMFGSFGLNLSDQYWFRPQGSGVRWEDINFFDNGYEHVEGTAFRTPDSSTPGALGKRWERIDGVDYLLKDSSTAESREPYNEVLATRLLQRLMESGEFVPYSLINRNGRCYSACPTMSTRKTEFVPAADLAAFAGITEGRDFYRSYVAAAESLGVPDTRKLIAKMIVADHVMANFDRHRGNFGLMRTVESLDGWRVAPLFDNGAGFFSRATMPELERSRYTWHANPFEEYPLQQLARAEDFSWYDSQMLKGFEDEVEEVLGGNTALPQGFAERAAFHVRRNIAQVNDVAAERLAFGI